MSTWNRPAPGPDASRTRTLQRAVWIVSGALLLSLLLFLGYYVWDRYVHLGDQSPIERGIAHMEKAIHEEPDNLEMRVGMADYYLAAGRYGEALAQATEILDLEPDEPGALLIAGIAYARTEEPEAALAPLQQFIALREDSPMAGTDTALEAAYYFLGESYVTLARPDAAIPVLEKALGISPTDADVLYQLGLAYQAGGQVGQALEYYRKAVRLVPDFAEVYHAMAGCYAALNQDGGSAYARGMEALSRGNYAAAQADLESAASSLAEFAPAQLGLALAYEQAGRLGEALDYVQRALALDPNDLAAQQAQGRIRAALDSSP